MKTAIADSDGRISRLGWQDAELPAGAVEVADIPPEPEHGPEEVAVPWLRGGAVVWEVEAVQPPEPEPEEEPTHEAVEAARQAAYRQDVDPLTAEISRLRDMEPGDPRIAEAEAEREDAVAAVVAANPYPEEDAQ